MLAFIIGIAALVFVGKFAVSSWGTPKVAAVLNRAFWVLWLLWSAIMLYIASASPDESGIAITLVVVPLIARYLVVFIVKGRLL